MDFPSTAQTRAAMGRTPRGSGKKTILRSFTSVPTEQTQNVALPSRWVVNDYIPSAEESEREAKLGKQ